MNHSTGQEKIGKHEKGQGGFEEKEMIRQDEQDLEDPKLRGLCEKRSRVGGLNDFSCKFAFEMHNYTK